MSDIVERLRISVTKGHEPTDEDAIDAKAEIERLRSLCGELDAVIARLRDENERLRAEIDRRRGVQMELLRENAELLELLIAARALLKHHSAVYPDEIDEAIARAEGK